MGRPGHPGRSTEGPPTALRPEKVEPWIGEWSDAIDGVTDLFTCSQCKEDCRERGKWLW